MRGFPRRSLVVSLTACSALLAGCGSNGGPRLDHEDGAQLITLVHRIAREGAAGRAKDIPRLRDRSIALVNSGAVPADLQEPLLSMVNALAVKPPDGAQRLEAWLRRHSR